MFPILNFFVAKYSKVQQNMSLHLYHKHPNLLLIMTVAKDTRNLLSPKGLTISDLNIDTMRMVNNIDEINNRS
jgi:hypothetical protein